jgi:hypothetical protein
MGEGFEIVGTKKGESSLAQQGEIDGVGGVVGIEACEGIGDRIEVEVVVVDFRCGAVSSVECCGGWLEGEDADGRRQETIDRGKRFGKEDLLRGGKMGGLA